MKKIISSRWLAFFVFCSLIITCFLPWTYYPDINETFTGFYSKDNIYGRPGRYLLIFFLLIGMSLFVSVVFIKQFSILLYGITLAYIVKIYIQFLGCYNGICPEIKIGLILLLPLSIFSFIILIYQKNIRKNV